MYTMNQEGNALVYRWDGEVLSIMPWVENSFRVRSTVLGGVQATDSALFAPTESEADIMVADCTPRVVNWQSHACRTVPSWA